MTRAAGSVALALGLTAWDAAVAFYAAVPAGLGVLTLTAALAFSRPRLIGPSAVLLAAGYGLSTIGQPVTGWAVTYGIGLLATTELAFWSLELRSGAGPLPGGDRRRWTVLAWTAAVSAAGAAVVLLVARAAPLGGGAGELAAAAGCVGVVGLLTGIARVSPD